MVFDYALWLNSALMSITILTTSYCVVRFYDAFYSVFVTGVIRSYFFTQHYLQSKKKRGSYFRSHQHFFERLHIINSEPIL